MLISSTSNDRVKGVVKLRQRSHRDTCGRMVVDGCREIGRALDGNHPVHELYCCPDLFRDRNEDAIARRCSDRGVDVLECTEAVFRKMAYGDRADGLLAVASLVGTELTALDLPDHALVVVAESIEKPGNLGAILRSADAAGVHAVLVCDRCTDVSNPNVVRASTGTVFSVPIVECSTDDALAWLGGNGLRTVASTPQADRLLSDVDFTRSAAVIVGREDTGLSRTWLDAADMTVRIPMFGSADSLNAAVSTTIVLYEAVRQRMATGIM